MRTSSIEQRSCNLEYDHLASVTEAVSSFTVDPLKSFFFYLFPSIGAWTISHQALRLNDPLQTMLLSEDAKELAILKVKELKEIAGISRTITVYTSDAYSCSSYGGVCSFTSPIISIPRGFLTTPSETIFQDIPTAEIRSRFESPIKPHWRFTPDEALFFIAREIANIKSNNPLFRVAAKVLFVASLFFIVILAMPTAVTAACMTSAIALHLIAERLMRSSLDIDAIKLLEALFNDKTRAQEAGESAIKKLIEQNKERRETNSLCRFYITERGNNYLDLNSPFLTSRLNHIEDYVNHPLETNPDPTQTPSSPHHNRTETPPPGESPRTPTEEGQ